MYLGNEYTLVELPAIEYLVSLGYEYMDGKKLTPENHERDSLNEVILSKRMFNSLKKLNPTISDENIRPDLVIFINGMPIAVLECKSPFKDGNSNENVGKYYGYEQLKRYMNLRDANYIEGAERLFYTNFITGILNKYTAFIGTISSGYKHYVEWKDAYPVENT